MNLLALDYGTKRIGLAWVDTEVGVVLPFGQMQNARLPEPRAQASGGQAEFRMQNFIELIEKERIDRMVVGLPLGLDGKENENTKRVRMFVAELKQGIDLPIEFVDERFTTAEAKRMGEEGVSADERAAMVILQSYLERLANSV